MQRSQTHKEWRISKEPKRVKESEVIFYFVFLSLHPFFPTLLNSDKSLPCCALARSLIFIGSRTMWLLWKNITPQKKLRTAFLWRARFYVTLEKNINVSRSYPFAEISTRSRVDRESILLFYNYSRALSRVLNVPLGSEYVFNFHARRVRPKREISTSDARHVRAIASRAYHSSSRASRKRLHLPPIKLQDSSRRYRLSNSI